MAAARGSTAGVDHHGQLGTGTVGGSSGVPVPVKSEGVKLVNVSARQEFSCAEGVSGGIYCWGGNFSGELGNNSQINSSEPVAVHVPAGVKLSGVSVGGCFACALAPNGAYCWGQNSAGKLGDGTATDRWTPVLVAGTKGP